MLSCMKHKRPPEPLLVLGLERALHLFIHLYPSRDNSYRLEGFSQVSQSKIKLASYIELKTIHAIKFLRGKIVYIFNNTL